MGDEIAAQGSEIRSCALCGTDLSGYRKGARFCSRAHSAEASRLRRLLSGQRVDGYGSCRLALGGVSEAHKRALTATLSVILDPESPARRLAVSARLRDAREQLPGRHLDAGGQAESQGDQPTAQTSCLWASWSYSSM